MLEYILQVRHTCVKKEICLALGVNMTLVLVKHFRI